MNIAEKIIDYNMNQLETKALRLCVLWTNLTDKEFPNYATNKLPKNGDPRKTYLFKIFYKLAKETEGVLNESEYELYITAQLQILKNLSFKEVHALIDPNCVIGEKAWVRWKVWKNKYNSIKKSSDTKASVLANIKPEIQVNRAMIIGQVKSSNDWINKNLNSQASVKIYEELIKSGLIKKWVSMDRVSPYFIVSSNNLFLAFKNLKIEPKSYFNFDYSLYEKTVNSDNAIKEKINAMIQ